MTVKERKTPRQFWRLGRVERLFYGKDSQVRSAVVRVNSEDCGTIELRWPVQRLYPLEVTSLVSEETSNKTTKAFPIRMVSGDTVPTVVMKK